jgi:transposase
MAAIDKLSVRNEVGRIKADFEQLCTDGKITSEIKFLMNSMLMIMELMLSIFLEKKTKKDNKNSSIPSSQTDKDESALDAEHGSNGKGKKEKPLTANNTRVKESIRIIEVYNCDSCGEDLRNTVSTGCERRTKIDIVFEKVVEHVDAQIKQCPSCDSTVKATFPTGFHGPLQYGDGLKAFVINLLACQMVALNRVQKLVKSMMNVALSEASLLKFVWRLHLALTQWEASAKDELLKVSAMHVDETSLRVDKKNHWIHVYSSGHLTLKCLDQGRGIKAIDRINIVPRYGGVIIHDCWASYFSYQHCGHGLCGSHLMRELTFIVESNGYAWAKNMKRLLKETCAKVSKSEKKSLPGDDYANLQKRFRNIITRGEKELPPVPPKPSGKRGKIAKSDAHNLWERMKSNEQAVLLFAKDPHVSFTNNRAERDLRMAKVKQKVSGCFRTIKYAQAYCRISSYLQTMASKGYNPLIAIQMALAGEIKDVGSV